MVRWGAGSVLGEGRPVRRRVEVRRAWGEGEAAQGCSQFRQQGAQTV